MEAVNYVARQNGKPEPLTIGMLREIDARLGMASQNAGQAEKLSTKQILAENMQAFKGEHYRALFATRKLSRQTIIIWAIWLTVGKCYVEDTLLACTLLTCINQVLPIHFTSIFFLHISQRSLRKTPHFI